MVHKTKKALRVQGFLYITAFESSQCCVCHHDAYIATAGRAFNPELDRTSGLGKQGVVLADANILAGVVTRTALTYKNVARQNVLATEAFYTKAFGIRVAAVTGTTACFRVCHCLLLELFRNCVAD
jgi:hypothetical protein